MLERVTMSLSGWEENKRNGQSIYYRHVEGGALSLSIVEFAPDIPREFERAAWFECARAFAAPGGLVSLDPRTIRSLPAMEFIYKRKQGNGFGYTGMLIIEWEGVYCYIVTSWREGSPTGLREAVLSVKLLDEGRIRFPKPTFFQRLLKTPLPLEGFFYDPYDRSYRGAILRSVCDEEEYDAQFPEHPLSLVRSHLRTVRETIRFLEVAPS
jgi:hypothetical protein